MLVDAVLLTIAFFLPQAGADPATRIARTDAVFAEWNRSDSPGCALAVYRDGSIVYARGYGMASLEFGVAIAPHTVFDIGSTSKQFTAASIALLAQDQKLTLDDDVRKHLPELPDYGTPITIRHLLNHTSGLRDYIEVMSLMGLRDQDRTTAAEAYAAVTRQQALNFAPGSKHLYSNTGYFLLAQIVERTSGQSMRDFARVRIFEPLGMNHTRILDDCSSVVRHKASSYEPAAPGGDQAFAVHASDWEQTGDGAVQTTVEDLQRWDENFYSGVVGGKEMRETLLTRGTLNDGTKLDYCAGLMVGKQRGLDTVSHGGAWAGFRAELLRFPQQHLSVACLCNLGAMDASGLAQQVAAIWLDAVMEAEAAGAPPSAGEPDARAAIEVPASELERFIGTFRSDDRLVRVTLDGGELRIAGPNVRPSALTPIGPGRFRREQAPRPMDVVFGTSDGKQSMRFEFPDGTTFRFEAIDPWAPSDAEMARFAGDYFSAEIGGGLKIALKDGVLTIVDHRTLPPLQLVPTSRDRFTCDLGEVQFQCAENAVSGFFIDGSRVKGLKYVRR